MHERTLFSQRDAPARRRARHRFGLANISITVKMVLAFVLMLVLAGSLAMYALIVSQDATARIRRAEEVRVTSAVLAAQAHAALLRAQANVHMYLVLGQRHDRENYERNRNFFLTTLAELAEFAQRWPEEHLVDEIQTIQSLFATFDQLVPLLFVLHDNLLANRPALRRVEQELRPLAADLFSLLERWNRSRPLSLQDDAVTREFRATLETILINARAYVLTGDRQFKNSFSSLLAVNTTLWNRQRETSGRADDLLTREMTELRHRLVELSLEIFDTAEGEENFQDQYTFRKEVRPLAETTTRKLEALLHEHQERLGEEINLVRRSQEQATTRMMILGVSVLVFGLALAVVLARTLSRPLRKLVVVAEKVGAGHLTVTLPHYGSDEVGRLTEAFDTMLGRLKGMITDLEEEIRTRRQAQTDLQDAHQRLQVAQERLVDAAHRAGMAKVATNVLHNVGNVLNSVNISISSMAERIAYSPGRRLSQVTALLSVERDELARFLTADQRGAHVPALLRGIAETLESEYADVDRELVRLRDSVEHIKAIIARQQDFVGRSAWKSRVSSQELLAEATRITEASVQRYNVPIEHDSEGELVLITDKHLVVQILVNLLKNGCEAVARRREEQGEGTPPGLVVLRMRTLDDWIMFEVKDNGIGISSEEEALIFQHGYSATHGGHGFGLHGSVLAARELGGDLTVVSKGRYMGASFRLRLPISDIRFQEEIP